LDCSEPLAENDLASRIESDCFSLCLLVIGAGTSRLHEVGVLFRHLLFKVSERVLALCILILWNDVLGHLSHILEALNEFTWLIIHNMNIETSHSSIVLECFIFVIHLGYKSSSFILELECEILRCGAEASLELGLNLGNLGLVIESELLHPHRENIMCGVKLNGALYRRDLFLGSHEVLIVFY